MIPTWQGGSAEIPLDVPANEQKPTATTRAGKTLLLAPTGGFHVSMYDGAIAGLVAFLASLVLPRMERRTRIDEDGIELVEAIDEAL